MRTGNEPARAGEAARRASVGPPPRRFDLLRWFSIVSLLALIPVAAVTGKLISGFLTQQTLQRDALLTAQFIHNWLAFEAAHLGTGNMAPFLDPRADSADAGLSSASVAEARMRVFEHLATLPDVLLANVYARDRRIVWSTNPDLVGTVAEANQELEQAFGTRMEVARHHAAPVGSRAEQRFVVEPDEFFMENYVPILDADGSTRAVVEVYKEPRNLMGAIRTCEELVWGTTLAGGALIYLGLFGIVRRGARALVQQQHRLLAAESQVFAGEMAAALAHSLRNPLGSVRSSAELAACSDDPQVRRRAAEIIAAVDGMSACIRELLRGRKQG